MRAGIFTVESFQDRSSSFQRLSNVKHSVDQDCMQRRISSRNRSIERNVSIPLSKGAQGTVSCQNPSMFCHSSTAWRQKHPHYQDPITHQQSIHGSRGFRCSRTSIPGITVFHSSQDNRSLAAVYSNLAPCVLREDKNLIPC